MADMFADEDSARFFQMMQMLQRSTLLQMGYLPDQSGTFHYNMGEAKEGIEVLRMFQRKTDGNLSDKETQMLRAVISELQMQFTQAPQRRRQREEEQAQSEVIRETFSQPQDAPIEDLSTAVESEEE
jgi:ABC-type phosphate transport system auxiliary subunit